MLFQIRRNRALAGLASLVLATLCADAQVDISSIDQAFADAAKAYDNGDPQEAVRLYGQILNQGILSPELLFNLGNAHYKNSEAGQAIRRYRQAAYLSPRDPDIEANLRFALDNHGAVSPARDTIQAVLGKLSMVEWIVAAVSSYWLTAAALCMRLGLARWRVASQRLLSAGAVILVVSSMGILQWVSLHRHPEAVVVGRSQDARFAPIEGSTVHFSLAEGSIVRMDEQAGEWVRIEAEGKAGWLPKAACAPVYPWQSDR